MSTDQKPGSIAARKGMLLGLIFGAALGAFFECIAIGIALGAALGYLYDGGYFAPKKGADKVDADPAGQHLDEGKGDTR